MPKPTPAPKAAVKKPTRAPEQAKPGKVAVPAAGAVGTRIQSQIALYRSRPEHQVTLSRDANNTPVSYNIGIQHGYPSATNVSRLVGNKLWAGKGTAGDLYRSYKNSPHHPSSLLLKYIVHRVNKLDAYDDTTKANALDDEFLDLHQRGGAQVKVGHVTKYDLHEWLARNPHLPTRLVQHRKHLHRLIRSGIGLNVKKIDGREHVALSRGLHSAVMRDEHSLASFTDDVRTALSFAGDKKGHVHHVWVPLEDLWYSFDMGPAYPRGEHGPEDEYLVSHHPDRPRYAADYKDVTQNRIKLLHNGFPHVTDGRTSGDRTIEFLTMDGRVRIPDAEFPRAIKGQSTTTRAFLAPILDDATEDEIVDSMKLHWGLTRSNHSDPDRLWRIRHWPVGVTAADGDKFVKVPPTKILAHIVAHNAGRIGFDQIGSSWVPRELASKYIDAPGEVPAGVLRNSHLNSDDLHHFIDRASERGPHHWARLGGRDVEAFNHVKLLLDHPNIDESHIERIYRLGKQLYDEGATAQRTYRDAWVRYADLVNRKKGPHEPGLEDALEDAWDNVIRVQPDAEKYGVEPKSPWKSDNNLFNESYRRFWHETLSAVAKHEKTPPRLVDEILSMAERDQPKFLAQQTNTDALDRNQAHRFWAYDAEGHERHARGMFDDFYGRDLTPEQTSRIYNLIVNSVVNSAQPVGHSTKEQMVTAALSPFFKNARLSDKLWFKHLPEEGEDEIATGIDLQKAVRFAKHIPPAVRREVLTSPKRRSQMDDFLERWDMSAEETDLAAAQIIDGKWPPESDGDENDYRRPCAHRLLLNHGDRLDVKQIVPMLRMLSAFKRTDVLSQSLTLGQLWELERAYEDNNEKDALDRQIAHEVEREYEERREDDPEESEEHIVRPLPHKPLEKAEPIQPQKALTHHEVGQKIRAQLDSQKTWPEEWHHTVQYDPDERRHSMLIGPRSNQNEKLKAIGLLHPHYSDGLVEESLGNLVEGHGPPELMYRNYKHTPHSAVSLLLKYAIHRVNNLDAYGDAGIAANKDREFLDLHQYGGAAEKNGHITPDHLHYLLWRNPHLPEKLLRTRDTLHRLVLKGVGLNVRSIGGEPHVALTRGLSSDTMANEHALSSFADVSNTGFGAHMHHTWVPLKDLWFGFPAAPANVMGNYGHEHEFLVSNAWPRYEATGDDVRTSLLSSDRERAFGNAAGTAANSWWPLHGEITEPTHDLRDGSYHHTIPVENFHAHAWDSSTDDEVAQSILHKLKWGMDVQPIQTLHFGRNAGRKTFEAIKGFFDAKKQPMPDWFWKQPFVPREEVMAQYRGTGDGYPIWPGLALENPNLNDGDLAELADPSDDDPEPPIILPFVQHPNYGEKTAHRLYDHIEENPATYFSRNPHYNAMNVLAHPKTPASVLDRFLNHRFLGEAAMWKTNFYLKSPAEVIRDTTSMFLNPNHTPEQFTTVLDAMRGAAPPPEMAVSVNGALAELYRHAKLSPEEIRNVWGAGFDDWQNQARREWLTHNPHISEQDLVLAANSNFDSKTMQALVSRMERAAYGNVGRKPTTVPTSVQHTLWDRIKSKDRGEWGDQGALTALVAVSNLDGEIAKEMLAACNDPEFRKHFDMDYVEGMLRSDKRKLPTSTVNSPARRERHIVQPLPLDPIQKTEPTDAEVAHAIAMLGGNAELAFEAARFIVGDVEPKQHALYKHESDVVSAALYAFGIDDDVESRRSIEALVKLTKFEGLSVATVPRVEGAFESSDTAAREILRAFQRGGVKSVALNGKHSKGSLVAKDPDSGDLFLLKPGSGSQSPAAGARQDPASQSEREVAFYRIADAWGVGNQMPRADLVLINGKEYAAIHMLPLRFRNFGSFVKGDTRLARRVLEKYRASGMLHKWAILDWVLGQTDRHSENMMVGTPDDHDWHDRPEELVLKLIDAGSAFAGTKFDPAGDEDTFIPYYLRAFTDEPFSDMSPEDRARRMPQAGHAEVDVRTWAHGLSVGKLQYLCEMFHIDPEPSLARLAQVQGGVTGRIDEAINKLWAGVA